MKTNVQIMISLVMTDHKADLEVKALVAVTLVDLKIFSAHSLVAVHVKEILMHLAKVMTFNTQ